MDQEDFMRAAREVGAHGDNDTLPFDGDARFVKAKAASLAYIANNLYQELAATSPSAAKATLWGLEPFSERLLVATGTAGFRVVTKIHPFWNVYLNGIGVTVARASEGERSHRACSYRFLATNDAVEIFDRSYSWRKFREGCISSAV